MAYYAKALATHTNSDFTESSIREIRKEESKVRDPLAREMMEQIREYKRAQKRDLILKTPEKLQSLQIQLEKDPLVQDKITQVMLKNLQLHLETVSKYANDLS